jgi:hypothetical protein
LFIYADSSQAKNETKEKEKQERELEKEREKEEKKDRRKKASLAERCALNRGTSFILTVEKKVESVLFFLFCFIWG